MAANSIAESGMGSGGRALALAWIVMLLAVAAGLAAIAGFGHPSDGEPVARLDIAVPAHRKVPQKVTVIAPAVPAPPAAAPQTPPSAGAPPVALPPSSSRRLWASPCLPAATSSPIPP